MVCKKENLEKLPHLYSIQSRHLTTEFSISNSDEETVLRGEPSLYMFLRILADLRLANRHRRNHSPCKPPSKPQEEDDELDDGEDAASNDEPENASRGA